MKIDIEIILSRLRTKLAKLKARLTRVEYAIEEMEMQIKLANGKGGE